MKGLLSSATHFLQKHWHFWLSQSDPFLCHYTRIALSYPVIDSLNHRSPVRSIAKTQSHQLLCMPINKNRLLTILLCMNSCFTLWSTRFPKLTYATTMWLAHTLKSGQLKPVPAVLCLVSVFIALHAHHYLISNHWSIAHWRAIWGSIIKVHYFHADSTPTFLFYIYFVLYDFLELIH
jgi:hypothetical protein